MPVGSTGPGRSLTAGTSTRQGGDDTGPPPANQGKTGRKHYMTPHGNVTPLAVITTGDNVPDISTPGTHSTHHHRSASAGSRPGDGSPSGPRKRDTTAPDSATPAANDGPSRIVPRPGSPAHQGPGRTAPRRGTRHRTTTPVPASDHPLGTLPRPSRCPCIPRLQADLLVTSNQTGQPKIRLGALTH